MNELARQLLFLPEQGSATAREIDRLHYFVIGSTIFGATAVALVGAWFLFRFKRKSAETPLTPRVVASVRVEVFAISGLLALFLSFWVIGFRQFRGLERAPDDALPVYVTAKQWMWKFSYPDGRSSIGVLTVPAGRAVKLLMTSRDVIHSFYVPDFRVKHDVVPGRFTMVWFRPDRAGVHDAFCAEFCGTQHSTMRAQVVALAPDDYARWLSGAATQPAAPGEANPGLSLVNAGRVLAAERGCLRCHSVDGTPHIGPTWAGAFGRVRRLAGGRMVQFDEAYITRSMMDPRAELAAGFAPLMPSFQGQLQPAETAAIVEYIRSLGGAP